jgi:DpiA-like helix-turn-helix domain
MENGTKTVASLHVCRGNWSKNESILLTGPYTPLLELFVKVNPDLLTLEFSTPRAGEPSSLLADSRIVEHTALGLGVINPRTDEIETLNGYKGTVLAFPNARTVPLFVLGKVEPGLTAELIVKEIGVSRTTARRYLEHLVSEEKINADLSYGTVGRPERIYIVKT